MQCTVIVRAESATRFVASPVGLPQLESTAPTEAEAVEQVNYLAASCEGSTFRMSRTKQASEHLTRCQ
jgi:hypothetical protein